MGEKKKYNKLGEGWGSAFRILEAAEVNIDFLPNVYFIMA